MGGEFSPGLSAFYVFLKRAGRFVEFFCVEHTKVVSHRERRGVDLLAAF